MRTVLRLAALLAVSAAPGLAAELPEGKELTNTAGMKLVRVEPGEFLMGCGEAPPKTKEEWLARDWDESPAHKVKITKALFMGAVEVTNAQYEQFDPEHRKLRGKFGGSQADAEPVTMVTWQNAVDFCAWLSKKEGKPYRLPTEAEWEYACRAGTATAFSTGDSLTHEQANIGLAKDGKTKTGAVPVAGYAPNAWGLLEMHGNVAEWCADWYGPYEPGEQSDPVGRADGVVRVARGGSYLLTQQSPRYFRSANRMGFLPEDANRCCGFRVVLGEAPATKPLPVPEPALFRREVKQTPAPKDGPDPAKPFFTDFKGKRPSIPENSWGPVFSAWNHFSGVCVCPNGDVLMVWYTTVGEAGRELAVAASRLPAGSDQWQPASLFFDVPDVNDHCPVLFCDGQRVYFFCNQSLEGWSGAAIMATSDDSGATWSKPRIIVPRGWQREINNEWQGMPESAFLTKDGVLGLTSDGSSKQGVLAISKDQGQTWNLTKGITSGRHPVGVALDDGRVAVFGRYIDPLPVSYSKDLGQTWEVVSTPFGIVGVGQKQAACRLTGGAVLLCAPDSRKIVGDRAVFAAVSPDGGRSWSHARKIEGLGVGGYLYAAQAPNGVVCLSGSRLGVVAFNEAWLKEGKQVEAKPAEPAPERK